MEQVSSFAEKARAKRRELRRNWTEDDERQWLADHPGDEPVIDLAPQQEEPEWDDDLVPDVATTEQSVEDREIERFLNTLGIIEAYNRWSRKGTVNNKRSKTEGIKVRCPNPSHPDNNPSAWLNTDKNVWVCGGCGMQGGDAFDIAAWFFGFPVPGYKDGKRFPDLRRRMAVDLGYKVVKSPSGKEYVAKKPDPVSSEPPAPTPETPQHTGVTSNEPPATSPEPDEPEQSAPLAPVVPITPQEGDPDDHEVTFPTIDWQAITGERDTFLSRWMATATDEELPDEYYFWLGMMALGLATREHVRLGDQPHVKANLFVCLIGPSGVGKSRSSQKLKTILKEILPEGDKGQGVRLVASPGSAEALIDSFSEVDKTPATDPATGETYEEIKRYKVAGLVDFSELSMLVSRSSRVGSTMKPTLIDFFDAYGDVTHRTRGSGMVEAHEPFAAVLATTQPRSIRELLVANDAESGFVNRWIFAGGPLKGRASVVQKATFDPNPSGELLKRINLKHKDDDTVLTYTEEALQEFQAYYDQYLWPIKSSDGNDLLSRSDLLIKKFCLLFAIDRDLKVIDVTCVRDAIHCWEYLQKMFTIIGRDIGLGEFDDCKRHIAAVIAGHFKRFGKGPKPKQLISEMNRTTPFSSFLIDKVLQTMIRMGEVEALDIVTQDENVETRYVNAR